MNDRMILLLFFVAAGLLLSGLALPMIWKKVRPNPWYGFRVPKTFRDEATWYSANQFAGKRLLWCGLATVAAAIALFPLPQLSLDAYALGTLAVFGFFLLLTVIQSFLYLRTL